MKGLIDMIGHGKIRAEKCDVIIATIGLATDQGRSCNSCIFPRWLAANLPNIASTTAAIWEEHRSFVI